MWMHYSIVASGNIFTYQKAWEQEEHSDRFSCVRSRFLVYAEASLSTVNQAIQLVISQIDLDNIHSSAFFKYI